MVDYGPRMRGVHKKERRKKAQYYIDLVGLHEFENTCPVKLSGGMRQRVGIARAYCNEPDIICMDELIKLWEKTGTTVIFITHNIEEAVYLSNRILVLTNKPTKIKESIDNTLPRPRNVSAPEFVEIRNRVTDLIKWW